MWVYILLILLAVSGICLCGTNIGGWRVILYLSGMGLLLTAVSSFRYAIGFDYFSYRDIYVETSALNLRQIFLLHKEEILFYLLCKVSSSCGLSYASFLTVINLFLHGTAMWFFFRFSKIPWLSVYLFIALQFLAHNMNLVRQSIAAAFFMLAFPALVKRRFLPFALLLTVGGLFHNTLFFMLPFYFLLRIKNSAKNMTVIAVAAAVLYLFTGRILGALEMFLPNRYSNYTGSLYWQRNSFRYCILPAVYLLLVLLSRRRLLQNPPSDQRNIRTIYVNSAFYTALINFFITKHFILERFSVYLFIFATVLIPEIVISGKLENLKVETARPAQIKMNPALCIFVLFGLCYFTFAASEGFHHVYPYVSLFEQAVSVGRPIP